MNRRLLPILAGCALLAACHSAGQPVVANAPVVTDSASAWITMDRGPCYGTCPVYSLRIGADGSVAYEGKRFAQTIGRAEAMMSSADLAFLRSAVTRADVEKLAPRYAYGEAVCAPYVTDMPSVVLTVTARGRDTRIQHDFGCGGAPARLKALEQAIDSATHVTRWTRGASGNQEK